MPNISSPHFVSPMPAIKAQISQSQVQSAFFGVQTDPVVGSNHDDQSTSGRLTDSQVGTFFCWLKLSQDTSTDTNLFSADGDNSGFNTIGILGADLFFVLMENNAGVQILDLNSNNTIPQDQWIAIMCSWDLSTVGTTNEIFVYFHPLDGVAIDETAIGVAVNDTVDWQGDVTRMFGFGATNFLGLSLSQFLLDDSVAIDFSQASEREKFVSAVGRPVDFGSDGSTPLGVVPAYYFFDGDPSNLSGWSLVGGDVVLIDIAGPGAL